MDQAQLLAWTKVEGLVREPTPEERRLAAEWDALSEEEKQVVTADFQTAAHLTQRHPLKAYDAVQLAVALRHYQALVTCGFSLTFVSGDNGSRHVKGD